MKSSNELKVGAVFLAVLMISLLVPQANAAVVWSDDFDDGNSDGWTTGRPDNFTCSNNYLEHTHNASSLYDACQIEHESNISLGTWSFDYYLAYDNTRLRIDFTMWLDIYATSVFLRRASGTSHTYLEYGSWVTTDSMAEAWNHIDVTTQDPPFTVDVFVNGIHRIHYQSLFPLSETTDKFLVTMYKIGDGMDNVAVSDSVDIECTNGTCELDHYTPPTITTEETTTTTTGDTTPTDVAALPMEWIALGGGIGVVLVVLVIFLKRK